MSLFVGNTQSSLAVQPLSLHLPMQGVQVRSLVGELRSHMPQRPKLQNIEQKQYYNEFSKDFKKQLILKKIYLKRKTNSVDLGNHFSNLFLMVQGWVGE